MLGSKIYAMKTVMKITKSITKLMNRYFAKSRAIFRPVRLIAFAKPRGFACKQSFVNFVSAFRCYGTLLRLNQLTLFI